MSPGALRPALEASHRQAGRLDEAAFPTAAFEALQAFQRERLARSYDEFARDERYRAAVVFFLDELYGGREAHERDQQVEAALPVFDRFLPARLKTALADAFRLQALSLELDIALAEALSKGGWETVDTPAYVSVYPAVPRARRETQIALIHTLALELERAVRLPMVHGLVRGMRRPAAALGFGTLQSFLERGLAAFRTMGDVGAFAETVRDRETDIMERLYRGVEDPFGFIDLV